MKPQIWTGVAAELNAHAMSTLQRIAQTIEQHYLPAPCRIEPSTVANACAMWRRIACSNVAVCLTLRFWHRQPAAAADCITGLTAVERVLADSCLTNEALRQAISKKAPKVTNTARRLLASGGLSCQKGPELIAAAQVP